MEPFYSTNSLAAKKHEVKLHVIMWKTRLSFKKMVKVDISDDAFYFKTKKKLDNFFGHLYVSIGRWKEHR